jgi:hypothetical protein
MQNLSNDIIEKGINRKSIQTVTGMSIINCMIGIVIDNASKNTLKEEMVWIYLVTAIIISLGVCLFVARRRQLGAIFLALLTAFPVYLGTTGANTILASIVPKKDSTNQTTDNSKSSTKSSMIEIPSFLQTRSWWLDDVIEDAVVKAQEATVAANLAENKLQEVDEKLAEIAENPNNAEAIDEAKYITQDAKRNLNKIIARNPKETRFTVKLPIETTQTANQNTTQTNQNTQANVATKPVSNEKINRETIKKAVEFERQGFEYILKKDFANASKSFALAEKEYPNYNNTYELSNYLKDSVGKDANEVYKTILTKYSWGMPTDVKTEMKKLVVNTNQIKQLNQPSNKPEIKKTIPDAVNKP